MSGREQGGATLIMLGALALVAIVLAWALLPYIVPVLQRLQEVGR